MFSGYEQLIYRVQNTLLSNENIRKLLFYNTPDALEKEAPSKEQLMRENYILTQPMECLQTNSLENNQATYVAVIIPRIEIESSNTNSSCIVKISTMCSQNIWSLNQNRIRLFQLANEITKELNNNRFGIAGQLEVFLSELQIYTANYVGYDLVFVTQDETTKTVEF